MHNDIIAQMLNSLYETLHLQVSSLNNPSVPAYILFASVSDGECRATTFSVRASSFKDCWQALKERTRQEALKEGGGVRWLRVDWVETVDEISWQELNRRLSATKRNYFRHGISLDRQFRFAFLETELNANAMLYAGVQVPHAAVNRGNFIRYMKLRNLGEELPDDDDDTVYQFSTHGLFVSADDLVVHPLESVGRNAGRRCIDKLDSDKVYSMISSSSRFLASQVKEDGRFIYGWHPSFDREIQAYNALRHASTLYSMIDAWEITRDPMLFAAIERSIGYLTSELIKTIEVGDSALAFLVDFGNELKLGGNAVCLLALAKYTEVTGDDKYLNLMCYLGDGILTMQDGTTGRFNHVLNYPDLSMKEPFRIIYYDGEAAFGMMRLYSLTRREEYLRCVEKAFSYFIENNHWQAHDHWLSYATNELTSYKPEARYFEFGIKNFKDYLDFVIERITTFPTLLELMMAAEPMVRRVQQMAELEPLARSIDFEKFYHALDTRAHYLMNGYFWPEMAMFFGNPVRIVGSFFIRHHAFRVRIDDVEHYLSGYCSYLRYLARHT